MPSRTIRMILVFPCIIWHFVGIWQGLGQCIPGAEKNILMQQGQTGRMALPVRRAALQELSTQVL